MPMSLHVYEEITLLALREKAGTVIGSSTYPYAVAGALAAELLISGRLRIEDPKKGLVGVARDDSMGDPLLDEALQRVRSARRRAGLRDWVLRFARMKGLKARAAGSLCQRGILRMDEKDVLLVFRQKVYPEFDPRPEREIVARLREVVMKDTPAVDSRTIVLVALAQAADLLCAHFTRGELKARKARIKALTGGDAVGKATREAIAALRAAVIAAAAAGAGAAAASG